MSERTGRRNTANGGKAGAFASRVSRALSKGGLRVVGASASRNREHIRVRAESASEANVTVDFDSAELAAERSLEVEQILRAAGYTVTRLSPASLHAAIGPGLPDNWKRRKNILGGVDYENRFYPGWVVEDRTTEFPIRKIGRKDLPGPFATRIEAIEWIEDDQAR